MGRFADWPLNLQMGPFETYMSVVPYASIGPSSYGYFTLGTYTMPFTGRLVGEMKSRCYWPMEQQWQRAHLMSSTPQPSAGIDHAQWSGLPGGFNYDSEVPMTAQWNSVAQGTVVTVVAAVYAGSLGTNVCVAVGGLLRAIPL